jgi:antitoxin PrlF
MGKLTITSKGQVTLNKDVLAHLDVRPGDAVEVEKLPGGELRVRSHRRLRPIAALFGSVNAPADVSLSIEDMNEVIAKGWAGEP